MVSCHQVGVPSQDMKINSLEAIFLFSLLIREPEIMSFSGEWGDNALRMMCLSSCQRRSSLMLPSEPDRLASNLTRTPNHLRRHYLVHVSLFLHGEAIRGPDLNVPPLPFMTFWLWVGAPHLPMPGSTNFVSAPVSKKLLPLASTVDDKASAR